MREGAFRYLDLSIAWDTSIAKESEIMDSRDGLGQGHCIPPLRPHTIRDDFHIERNCPSQRSTDFDGIWHSILALDEARAVRNDCRIVHILVDISQSSTFLALRVSRSVLWSFALLNVR